MPNDERILNVLQQTLTEIQRHATLDHYLQELELVTENNNVM